MNVCIMYIQSKMVPLEGGGNRTNVPQTANLVINKCLKCDNYASEISYINLKNEKETTEKYSKYMI